MTNTAVANNTTDRSIKVNTSQPSLWDSLEEQELTETLTTWAVRNAYPELATVGVKPGRSNWEMQNWDLPRLETVYQAADLFSQRHRAYFALSHWAIMQNHPRVEWSAGKTIEAGLTSWVAWCKDASLEDLHLALETVGESEARR